MATPEIYTLSLHDALPISLDYGRAQRLATIREPQVAGDGVLGEDHATDERTDRKSTRLNSSHANISYAVFCLKKKNQINNTMPSDRPEAEAECVLQPETPS